MSWIAHAALVEAFGVGPTDTNIIPTAAHALVRKPRQRGQGFWFDERPKGPLQVNAKFSERCPNTVDTRRRWRDSGCASSHNSV